MLNRKYNKNPINDMSGKSVPAVSVVILGIYTCVISCVEAVTGLFHVYGFGSEINLQLNYFMVEFILTEQHFKGETKSD